MNISTSTPRRVVGLIRVSSDGQAKDDKMGLPRQIRDLAFHCKKFNLNLIHTFHLEGISGAVAYRSKEFQAMMEQIGRPDIAGLVVPSIDRFSRKDDFSTIGKMMEPFEAIMGGKSKLLWCDAGELNVENRDDRNKIWNALQYAAMEREKIAYRTGEAREMLRANSTACIDRLPFGVRHVRTNPKENFGHFEYTAEAVKVRTAFERLLAGDTIRAITHDLGFGSQTALRKSLKSEWWIGYKTRLKTCVGKVWIEDKDKYSTGKCVAHSAPIREKTNLAENPLVSVETFDAVQAVLNQNLKTWTCKKSVVNNYLGTGLVFCGCGRKMYLKVNRSNPAHYACASRIKGGGDCHEPTINASRLDSEIEFQTIMRLTDPTFIASKLKQSMNAESIASIRRSIERTEKEVAELNRRKGNILAAIEQGAGELADYATALAKNKLETAEAQNKIRILKSELKATMADSEVAAVSHAIFCDFANFGSKPMIQRKAILAKYVEKIAITFPLGKGSETFDLEFSVKAGLPAAYEHGSMVEGLEPSAMGLPGGDGGAILRLASEVTKLEITSRTGSLLLLSAQSRRSSDEPY